MEFKMYKCSKCPMEFSSPQRMFTHMRRLHVSTPDPNRLRDFTVEERSEILEALEGAIINPGDEITTKRLKEYKSDIHGKLFRVPDGSLGFTEEGIS